jgi:hypothetical protein
LVELEDLLDLEDLLGLEGLLELELELERLLGVVQVGVVHPREMELVHLHLHLQLEALGGSCSNPLGPIPRSKLSPWR